METQPEIVVAAEALRTWVHTQRAGWTTPHPAVLRSTPLVESPAAARQKAGAAAAPAAAEAPKSPVVQPQATPSPAPVTLAPVATAPAAAPVSIAVPQTAPVLQSAAPSRDLFGEPPTHEADDEPKTPLLARTWVRAAITLAAVVALAAGGLLLRGRTGNLGAAPKSGTVVLASEPTGASVMIDGQASGTTPVTLNLPVGKHVIEFTLKSATRKQTVDVARGKETTVSIDWNAKPVGALKVEARPTPARVLVDGKDRGSAPVTIDNLPVGSHTVQIETSEGSIRRKVDIVDGRTESMSEEIFPGWLHVSSPIEITVVDGKQSVQLDASNRVLLKPGPHTIRIQNQALALSETRQVTIEPGGTATVTIAPQQSTLTVLGSSGADVFIDGTRAGETPLVDFAIKLGAHDVMVVDKSGATRHASVTVTTRPTTLDIAFQKP